MQKKILRLVISFIFPILSITTAAFALSGDTVIPLPDVVEADGSLGTGYTFYTTSGEPLPPYANRAGSRWDRFDFRWNQIEDSQGTFTFDPHENIVDLDLANDIDIIAILGSTAQWATGGCQVASAQTIEEKSSHFYGVPLQSNDGVWWRPCPPNNLHLEWNHPDNYWGNFVYQTVSHFKDKISVWEMWNEPDWDVFWTGTPAEYAQLLKVGYQAAKAADPNAVVLFGGLAYHFEPYFYRDVFDQLVPLDPGGTSSFFFDALSLHLYSDVYNISYVVNTINSNMATSVGQHPIWLTEVGVPVWEERWNDDLKEYMPGNPYPNSSTFEEASFFVIQAYSEARALGIEKFIFFRMHDEAMDETFGLMRNDLSLRPAYVSYQVTARYLHGENQITGPFTNNGIRRITYWGTPRGRIDVLWNTEGGESVEYAHPAVLPTATLVDHRGVTQTLQATNGVFSVTLSAATANTGAGGKYIIGGSPVLLIQADTGLPQSALHTLPAVTYGSNVTLTWDIADSDSGPWYLEVERSTTSTGPWTQILDWSDTNNGITQTILTGQQEGDWYFHARARDNVWNWESWPASAETWTTVNLSRTLSVSITTYIDANSNNIKDTGEYPPSQTTTMALKTAAGDLISDTITNHWGFVQTLREGDYVIQIKSTGLIPDTMQLNVRAGGDVMVVTSERGLKPVAAEVYIPFLLRK